VEKLNTKSGKSSRVEVNMLRSEPLFFLAKPGKIAICSRKNKSELVPELKYFSRAVIYSRADYWEMILKNRLIELELFYSRRK
jgi:hypothetical protein